jgi:hypothetical protein
VSRAVGDELLQAQRELVLFGQRFKKAQVHEIQLGEAQLINPNEVIVRESVLPAKPKTSCV